MNLFADIRAAVLDALDALEAEGALPAGLDRRAVAVEPPRDRSHGDMATNAAMVLAKPAGMKPRDIAAALAPKLAADPRIAAAEVAGPGFLNLTLAPVAWHDLLAAIVEAGADFGRSEAAAGRRVNVEFVSANPTGPLHLGHVRGAVFGDALASLLAFTGHEVTREYYINDGGAQVDTLARSVYLRYLEAGGQEVAFADGTYPGDYLIPVGAALRAARGDAFDGKGEQYWLAELRDYATDAMMEIIRDDLALIGIEMDRYFSEKSLYG
ncbi:MAG: arginine--tRNA ligase, partial [Pseudomonadota bacterium]